MQKEFNLPEEMLDEYARAYVNATRRASYARHPERVMRQRLKSAAYLLARHGLIEADTLNAIISRVGVAQYV